MPRTTIRTEDVNAAAAIAQSKLATIAADALSGNMIDGGTISNFASTGIDDNADALAVTIDSSERVGIGTASPQAKLQVGAESGAPGLTSSVATMWAGNRTINAGGTLHLMTNDSVATDVGASINLGGNYSGTSASIDFAQIAGRSEAGGVLGYMALSTRSAGAETEKVRIDSDGNMLMKGNGSIAITYVSVADDAVTSFTPGSNRGMIFLGGDSTHMGAAGYVCKAGATQETYELLDSAGTFAVGTGVPTGTTGADAKITLFAASADGKLYFENRLGGSFTFWYFCIGTPW